MRTQGSHSGAEGGNAEHSLRSSGIGAAYMAHTKGRDVKPLQGDVQVLPFASSDAILSGLFPRVADPVPAARQLSVHPIFLLGMFLLYCGAILRKRCHRTLGRHFTFQLTILKEHKLVTSGPYAIVRHPSYTGIIIATVGVFMMGLSPGSWLVESGIIDTFQGTTVVAAWLSWYTFMTFGFLRRTRIEDAVLREEFGAQWDEWARKVPYQLVPYVW
ncbi:hypothetical protein ACG7TL_002159 [Trametes sanguinea]